MNIYEKVNLINFEIENYLKNYGLFFTIKINNLLVKVFVNENKISELINFYQSKSNIFHNDDFYIKIFENYFQIKTFLGKFNFEKNKLFKNSLKYFIIRLQNCFKNISCYNLLLDTNIKINLDSFVKNIENVEYIEKKHFIVNTDIKNNILYFCNRNSIISCDFLTGFLASKDLKIKIIMNRNFGLENEIIFYQKLPANKLVLPICNIIPIFLCQNSFIGIELEDKNDNLIKYLNCYGINVNQQIKRQFLNNLLQVDFKNNFGGKDQFYYYKGIIHYFKPIINNDIKIFEIKSQEIEKDIENLKKYTIVLFINLSNSTNKKDINTLCQKFGTISQKLTKEYYTIKNSLKNFEVFFYCLEDAQKIVKTYHNCQIKKLPIKLENSNKNEKTTEKMIIRNIDRNFYYFYENLGIIFIKSYDRKYITNIFQVTCKNKDLSLLNDKEKINYIKCFFNISDNLLHFDLKDLKEKAILIMNLRNQKNSLTIHLNRIKKSENLNNIFENYKIIS